MARQTAVSLAARLAEVENRVAALDRLITRNGELNRAVLAELVREVRKLAEPQSNRQTATEKGKVHEPLTQERPSRKPTTVNRETGN